MVNWFNSSLRAIAILCIACASSFAIAQPAVTVGSGEGGLGATVGIPVSFDPGGASVTVFNITVTVSDPTQFDSFSAFGWDDGSAANCPVILPGTIQVSCSTPGSNEFRFIVESLLSTALPSLQFGLVEFVIANDATVNETVNLTVTTESYSDADAQPVNPGTSTNGTIEILDIAPVLEVNPLSLSFSTQFDTTSAAQSVEACNVGNEDGLIVTPVGISGADADNFAISSNNCPASPGLNEDDCCTIGVTFSPDAIATFDASLDIESNGGSESVTLQGQGTAGPPGAIDITPASHDFGDLLANDETGTFSFTVTNTASPGSAVAIDTVELTGDTGVFSIDAETCTGSLAAGASCTVTVEFAPDAAAVFSATLTVSGEDGNGDVRTDSATVEGEGVIEARFSSSPAPGNVNLGFTGADLTASIDILVSNNGNEALTLDCSLADGEFFDFTAPASIAAGESAAIAVSCEIPDLASYSDTLTCATNDAANASVSYALTCSGREPLPVPTMSNWSIALFAMFMLLVGGISIRFFRA